MQVQRKRKEIGKIGKGCILPCVAVLFWTAGVCLLSCRLIRNTAVLLERCGVSEKLCRVFAALADARLRPAVLPALVFAAFAVFLLRLLRRKIRRAAVRIHLCGLLLLIFTLLSFAVTLYTVEVNGVRFGDVLRSLLTYAAEGALDAL